MTEDDIFKLVQKYLENVPLILIGTGGTIPYGIPGMSQLATYLLEHLSGKYKDNLEWEEFSEKLLNGMDLENALTDLILDNNILNDIVKATWQLVTDADLRLLYDIIHNKSILPLSKLINKFYQPHPQCVNIITTNYDRVIEYACDQINVKIDTKLHGNYIKYFSHNKLEAKQVVNLLKVHGSLDLFKNENNLIYSIPIQKEIPYGFIPEIITPGSSKYRSVLQGTCRQVLHDADNLINNAKCFLCIGYGFNDEQIQTNIITEIKTGKPIVVATKKISGKATELLVKSSNNYVIIQECENKCDFTEFIINNQCIHIQGTYWTVDGLMKIIE